MDPLVVIQQLLFSGLLGLLVGIEREFDRAVKKSIPLGARTMVFISLLGCVSVIIAGLVNDLIIITSFVAVILLFIISYRSRIKRFGDRGLTTYVAALMVFITGVLAGFGELLVSVIIGVLTAFILSVSPEVHKFARLLSRQELRSVILFAVISFVILPLLPDKYFGVFNPFRFWLVVVIVCALSFLSYVLLRAYHSGVSVSGFIGGFISSRLVLLQLRDFNAVLLAIISSIIANSLLFIISVGDLSIINVMSVIVIAGFIIFLVFKRGGGGSGVITPSNPFSLINGLRIALIIIVITQLSVIISGLFNGSSLFFVIALGSFASSLATTASIISLLMSGAVSMGFAVQLLLFLSLMIIVNVLFFSFFISKRLFHDLLLPLITWSVIILLVIAL